tara:strand:+ start:2368 stop:2529 length:162 start_codon:yes stop_codon:yes gene_type:complete
MSHSQETIDKYIAQLSDDEIIVYHIAKDYLETSFDLEKSIGFISWFNKNNTNI